MVPDWSGTAGTAGRPPFRLAAGEAGYGAGTFGAAVRSVP
jgi:hypothetical protein